MKQKRNFEEFKKQTIQENEEKYGKEIREKYGEKTIDESNRKMLNMTEEEYQHFKELEESIREDLKEAVENKEEATGETGKRIALLHKEWLTMTWSSYSALAHQGLVQMYVADERFKGYYDKEIEGCAVFLKEAVEHWIK